MTGRMGKIAAAVAAGLLLAAALRHGLLENAAHALRCREAPAAAGCTVREALGWLIYHQLIGLSGLALAAAAWLPPLRRLALPALLVAGCGLALYNTTYAAIAAIIALLAALQPQRIH